MVPKRKIIFNVLTIVVCARMIHGASGEYFSDYEDNVADTVYCFQCNSGLDIDCAHIQPNDTQSFHYKPCLDTEKYKGSRPFCRKIVQRIMARDNMERVIRKCGWVRHSRLDCYNFRNDDHMETICQCFENGCNGSPSLYATPLATLITLLLGHLVGAV